MIANFSVSVSSLVLSFRATFKVLFRRLVNYVRALVLLLSVS